MQLHILKFHYLLDAGEPIIWKHLLKLKCMCSSVHWFDMICWSSRQFNLIIRQALREIEHCMSMSHHEHEHELKWHQKPEPVVKIQKDTLSHYRYQMAPGFKSRCNRWWLRSLVNKSVIWSTDAIAIASCNAIGSMMVSISNKHCLSKRSWGLFCLFNSSNMTPSQFTAQMLHHCPKSIYE